ncbi:adenine deaminase [Terrimonas sp.]|uniref:adenine deaminase n=1 Tax=Terrimonas sp. TaxID=1914338 RepID=UPI000D50A395|nr:adenine deaminase [Terrimonas sp.]PVD54201.1 adenine deaminase [Terrimonas sp.]
MNKQIRGRIVDILQKKIYAGIILCSEGKILSIQPLGKIPEDVDALPFIIPGFIDAHVHVESSMLIPSQFARLAVVHGTVATVSDPHEIANVCGMAGVQFMIEDGRKVPLKFYFGAPSCVPATVFETAGAELNAADITKLLEMDEIKYLSEMMNFPGVLHKDREVMAKIAAAHKLHKPVDGHAPGLTGELAKQYINAGISTDHECFTKQEALDKLKFGMHILIREGSAAKNFEALIDLLNDYPERIMFCSDDKHPDSLVEGHIDQLCARAVAKGIDVFNVLRAACINPALHYKLETGLLKEGDNADFIVVKDLVNFKVLQTYIRGELVAENGKTLIGFTVPDTKSRINNFSCDKKIPADFAVAGGSGKEFFVIEALDGQLITNILKMQAPAAIDIDNDILKIAVVNRYADTPAAVAFIKNFGLKQGAIASSVAHDSHNIVVVGTSDESICEAVNMIIEQKGGVSLYSPDQSIILPLPVAGLMSDEDGYTVAEKYSAIDKAAKSVGSTLSSPFMTLSFMALLVIPHLKLSDKGLFDGDRFEFVK